METLSTYQRVAEEAGFVVERLKISATVLLLLSETRAYANREKVIKLVNEEYWQQFVNAWLSYNALAGKKLGYGMMLATK